MDGYKPSRLSKPLHYRSANPPWCRREELNLYFRLGKHASEACASAGSATAAIILPYYTSSFAFIPKLLYSQNIPQMKKITSLPIGGFLRIYIILFILSIIRLSGGILSRNLPNISDNSLSQLEFVLNISTFIWALYLVLLFFKKKKSFIELSIKYYIYYATTHVFYYFLINDYGRIDTESIREVIRAMLYSLIWTLYLKRSKRVKKTFTQK